MKNAPFCTSDAPGTIDASRSEPNYYATVDFRRFRQLLSGSLLSGTIAHIFPEDVHSARCHPQIACGNVDVPLSGDIHSLTGLA